MKILMVHDGRAYAGTPTTIVEQFRAALSRFMDTVDVDDYMLQVSAYLREDRKPFRGNTTEERCQSFVDDLVESGLAELIDE